MPTILTHAVIPLATGLGLGKPTISRRLMLAGIVASMLPDLDVLAFRFHIPYANEFGHRGASHSLAFALLIGLLALLCANQLKSTRGKAFLFVSVSTASHGLLDMFTNGGHGVALWWPFSTERLFAAWRVVEVSPITLERVFSARGMTVLQSELIWVWLPATLACITLILIRKIIPRKVK
jgi:inner membrane protein